MPVVVALPAEIDFTNAEEVCDRICAAFQPGVAVVIADLTGTMFSDTSGIRHLLLAHERAEASQVQLRFAVPADCPVRRVLKLTGVHRVLAVYPSLDDAMAGGPPQALAEPRKRATGEPPAHPLALEPDRVIRRAGATRRASGARRRSFGTKSWKNSERGRCHGLRHISRASCADATITVLS